MKPTFFCNNLDISASFLLTFTAFTCYSIKVNTKGRNAYENCTRIQQKL